LRAPGTNPVRRRASSQTDHTSEHELVSRVHVTVFDTANEIRPSLTCDQYRETPVLTVLARDVVVMLLADAPGGSTSTTVTACTAAVAGLVAGLDDARTSTLTEDTARARAGVTGPLGAVASAWGVVSA
jgi:hypothetical protein